MRDIELPTSEFFSKLIEISPEIKKVFDNEDQFLMENIKKDSTVLDVGCGFGRHMKMLSSKCKRIIGIDNSKDEIDLAKNFLNGIKNIELFLEDITDMSFPDQTFDFVICMGNTFGNIKDNKTEILREMRRVTKKGGKIIISTYTQGSSKIRVIAYKKAGLKIKEVKEGTVYFEEGLISEEFSEEQLKSLFESVNLGVQIIKSTPISFICIAKVK